MWQPPKGPKSCAALSSPEPYCSKSLGCLPVAFGSRVIVQINAQMVRRREADDFQSRRGGSDYRQHACADSDFAGAVLNECALRASIAGSA